MKILFLTSRLPFPPIGGDKLRTFHFLKHLKKDNNITLVSFIEKTEELDNIKSYDSYFDSIKTMHFPKIKSYMRVLVGIFSKLPLQICYYKSQKMERLIKMELTKDYDVVFCHLIRMSQYLPEKCNAKKIIDFTDAISLNHQRSLKYRNDLMLFVNWIESKRVKRYEFKSIDYSDVSIFISTIDSDFLTTQNNKDKIKIIKNGVDIKKFSFYQGNYDQDQISFIGNMRTFPNCDAVLYFCKKIFPLLLQKRPSLKFYIVGSEPTKKIKKLHNGINIFVTGFVDSVIPYIQKSVVVVAPMRVGAGVQNKILESLAVGTPVITSTVGAEGLDNNKLTIANTNDKIVNLIMSFINDDKLRKIKSIQGRKYIEDSFEWKNILSKFNSLLT